MSEEKFVSSAPSVPAEGEYVEIVIRYRRASPESGFELAGSKQVSSTVVLSGLQVMFLLTEFVRGAMAREFPLIEEKLVGVERKRIVDASGLSLPDLKRMPH
jgi:hypothetical protein